ALTRVAEYFFHHPQAKVLYHDDSVEIDGWRFANEHQPATVDFLTMLRGHILFQDGVFFHREVYEAVGGLNRSMKLAGDWALWPRMARKFRFTRLPGHRSCFRVRTDQLSADSSAYLAELDKARAALVATLSPGERWYWRVVNLITRVRNKLDRVSR